MNYKKIINNIVYIYNIYETDNEYIISLYNNIINYDEKEFYNKLKTFDKFILNLNDDSIYLYLEKFQILFLKDKIIETLNYIKDDLIFLSNFKTSDK